MVEPASWGDSSIPHLYGARNFAQLGSLCSLISANSLITEMTCLIGQYTVASFSTAALSVIDLFANYLVIPAYR